MTQADLFAILAYPEIGKIAVTVDGNRIAVWPDEGDDPECFTGQLLEEGASLARARTANLSVFWRRDVIRYLDHPSDADRALSLVELDGE